MSLPAEEPREKRGGRPRAFNESAAVDAALHVFWARGYDSTSIGDLTGAMQMHPPSLYNAFGSKEELFCRAVARYSELQGPAIYRALDEAATADEAIIALLRLWPRMFTQDDAPHGCLLVRNEASHTAQSERAADAVRVASRAGEQALLSRIRRGQKAGDFPASLSATEVAALIHTFGRGLAVRASTGASRSSLTRLTEAAVHAFRTLRERMPREQERI